MELVLTDTLFRARLERPDHGLRYLGPTLRGAFGFALKRIVCVVPPGDCARCRLQRVCAYPTIFDGLPPDDPAVLARYTSVPQPFVLEVAPPGRWWGEPDELVWGMRLFGPAARYLPYLVEAFDRIGTMGLGPRRVSYELLEVRDRLGGRDALWEQGRDTVAAPTLARAPDGAPDLGDTVRIRFETPVNIRRGGSFLREVDPVAIVSAARRRLRLLRAFYASPARDEEREPGFVEADEFEVLHSDQRVWSISRYSGRQKRKAPLHGVVGELVARGPWQRVADVLAPVPLVHLGKHCSFGFGRVTVEGA